MSNQRSGFFQFLEVAGLIALFGAAVFLLLTVVTVWNTAVSFSDLRNSFRDDHTRLRILEDRASDLEAANKARAR